MEKERFAAILVNGMTSVYSFGEAASVGAVLAPAVMNDFKEKIKTAKIGDTVSEEYKTEDEKVLLLVEGKAVPEAGGAKYVISKVMINGMLVSEEELRL